MRQLVDLADVMEKLELGPNGGLLYCMEYLEKNIDWLKERLEAMPGLIHPLFIHSFILFSSWSHPTSFQSTTFCSIARVNQSST